MAFWTWFQACPSADDLINGIVLEDELGGNARIDYCSLALKDGLYWQGWMSTLNSDGWQIYRYEGLFEVLSVRTSGSFRKLTIYDHELSEIFPLSVGDQHQFGSTHTNEVKNLTWVWEHNMTVKSEQSVSIGSCSYNGLLIDFDDVYERSDGVRKKVPKSLIYVPELKVAFEVSKFGNTGLDRVRSRSSRDAHKAQPIPLDLNAQLERLNGKIQ